VPVELADLREKLCSSAVQLCELINYRSAGTVEFLVDDETAEYYFLELNARLQVEHPVTEAIRPGLDLSALMLKLAISQAESEPFELPSQETLSKTQGHAIEARESSEHPIGFTRSNREISNSRMLCARCLCRDPAPQLQACARTASRSLLPVVSVA